ncbi:hypothetical protein [Brucella haematophila]|uniref:Uncharacterized protein n=1 Tax=Brucella haematophila TaxID=419474 RepID=A0ABX1DPW6_9HYPH|nr:hypothetical protein [Brucella haematophila]NKC03317.1 hypothetical protein [Brucella haematophila]TMU84703.1 hypothetical protein FGI60_26020 [Brucella haematophila]
MSDDILGSALEQDLLVCANCGCEYTHHFKVEVFHRKEDADTGHKVVIGTNADGEAPCTDKLTFTLNADVAVNGHFGPSARRHGLIISYICEECQKVSGIAIYQHKGQTFLECGWVGEAA